MHVSEKQKTDKEDSNECYFNRAIYQPGPNGKRNDTKMNWLKKLA